MPKKPDSELESRILNVAYKLWAEEGEHGLTMRAVARAARTTTPTLYERFRDKEELLAALRSRAQQKLFEAIKTTRTIGEAVRIALEFTVTHGHEYQLLAKDWAVRLSRREPTPSFHLIQQRLSEQFGGAPNEHRQLALALTALYIGVSSLLLAEGIQPEIAAEIKSACVTAADTLVAAAGKTESVVAVKR